MTYSKEITRLSVAHKTALKQRDDAVTTLKLCAEKFRMYTEHHLQKGDEEKAASNAVMLKACEETIKRATGSAE